MAARGLTRQITRKQAKSYEISSPNGRARRNPMGVTAIASVNGRGNALKAARLALMKKRGARDLRQIAAGRRQGAPYAKTTKQAARSELRRRGLANPSADYADRYARTRAILARNGDDMAMMNRRRRARRNDSARELGELYDVQMRRTGKPKTKRAPSRKAVASRARARRTAVSKRYKPLKGRVLGRRTYLYKAKGGKARKIPLWAILGQSSKKAFERRVADDPRLARRVVAAKKRRDRAADKLRRSGDAFTPNRRRKSMKARRNYRLRKGTKLRGRALSKHRAAIKRGRAKAKRAGGSTKRTGSRKRRSPAQRRATARMLSVRWGRKIRRRKAWKNKATTAIPNRRKRRSRRNPITQAAANPRRRKRRKARRNPITQAAANRRRRRRSRRNPITQAAANPRRRRRRKARRNPITQAAANPRRRRRRKARRNVMYSANPRRRGRKARRNLMYSSNRRRRARRNGDIMGQLTNVLKVGAAVLVGFVAHRGLTWLVSEKALTKIDAFNTGTMAEYRGLLAGALVAGVGIAALAKFAPSQVAKAGVGMGVSFLHGVLLFGLKKLGQPEVAGYFAAYPDAEGVAYHTMGSYEELPPGYAGMGEYDYYNQYSGTGGNPSMGEYEMTGLSAFGEYESTEGTGGMGAAMIDEGIHPNLAAAERALSVAEAAAGVGDFPLQSTVNPYQIAAPVQDAPGGSRAGILQGDGGIFG